MREMTLLRNKDGERERERERDIYIYIYIYEKERGLNGQKGLEELKATVVNK